MIPINRMIEGTATNDTGIILSVRIRMIGNPHRHTRIEAGTSSPEESVRGMRKVIDEFTLEDSGRFIQYDGTELPW